MFAFGSCLAALALLRLSDMVWPTKPLRPWFYCVEFVIGCGLALYAGH